VGFSQGPYDSQHVSQPQVHQDFSLIKQTGARWVRLDAEWSVIQPQPPPMPPQQPHYTWTWLDRAIPEANADGLNVLLVLNLSPGWANGGAPSDHYAPTTAHIPDYVRFATAVVQRYAPQGVHTYEVWNEPNNASFWLPQPDANAYTQLLRAAYPAIHAADSQATVLNGGLAALGDPSYSGSVGEAPERFLNEMYLASGGTAQGYFDALSDHVYSGPDSPTAPSIKAGFCRTANINAIMNSFHDQKPIWATEAGQDSTEVNQQTQATYIAQYATMWKQWNFPTGPIFIHTLRDVGSSTFGLLHRDLTHKPAYDALQRALS
jgi:hypothetical protein